MFLYIAIIFIEDSVYQGDVGYVALYWKESKACLAGGALCLLSLEMSTVATLLIACDRFICIVVTPFRKKGFTLTSAGSLNIIMWCAHLLLLFIISSISLLF